MDDQPLYVRYGLAVRAWEKEEQPDAFAGPQKLCPECRSRLCYGEKCSWCWKKEMDEIRPQLTIRREEND